MFIRFAIGVGVVALVASIVALEVYESRRAARNGVVLPDEERPL